MRQSSLERSSVENTNNQTLETNTGEKETVIRKYLNYIIFGGIVLFVVALAALHSRHMHFLLTELTSGTPQERASAANELIVGQQFSDSIADSTVSVRVQSAVALADLNNPDAVKQAIQMLKDQDKPVSEQALKTLEQIGASNPANLKALAAGLGDGDAGVRRGVVKSLSDPEGGIGPRTNPDVVQALVAEAVSTDASRAAVGDVLSSSLFDPSANSRSVPALELLLTNKDDTVKQGAADALGKIGDQTAAPSLLALLHNPQTSMAVQNVVVGALGLIAAPSSQADLIAALKNPVYEASARAQAAEGLGSIASPQAVEALLQTLTTDNLGLRSSAVTSLARAGRVGITGKPNPSIVSQLVAALNNPAPQVKLGIAKTLGIIASPQAAPALISLLKNSGASDSTEAIRIQAADALGFPDDKAGIAPLIEALTKEQGKVAKAASEALSRIGASASPALIKLLGKGDVPAFYAASALGLQGAGTDSKQTLAALQKAANSPNTRVQRWAAVALGDTNLQGAQPILEQLTHSPDPEVAYVARHQIDGISHGE